MAKNNSFSNVPNSRSGFTIVEVVVTIVLSVLFVITITQLNLAQSKVVQSTMNYNQADMLAYNNLRIFAYGGAPTWFTCTYNAGSAQPMTVLSSTSAVSGLPSPVIQTVIADAPYGCGGGSAGIGYPIRVTSTVTYGQSAQVVSHAVYASY